MGDGFCRKLISVSFLLILLTGLTSSSYYKESVDSLNKSELGFDHPRAYSVESVAGTRCDSESPVITSNDSIEVVEKTINSETFVYETKTQCGNNFQLFLSDSYVYKLDDNVVRYTERKQEDSFRPYFYSLNDDPTIRYENGNFVVLEDEKLIESPNSGPVWFDYSKFTREGVSGSMDEEDFDFSGKLFYANERYTVDFDEPKAKCKVMDLYTNETLYLEKECIDSENNLILIEGRQIFNMSSKEFFTVNLPEKDTRDYRLTDNGVFVLSAGRFFNFDSESMDLNRDYSSVDWINGRTLWTESPENQIKRIELSEISGKDFCGRIETKKTSCAYKDGCQCSSSKNNQSVKVLISQNTLEAAERELNRKISAKLDSLEPVGNHSSNSTQTNNLSKNSSSSARADGEEKTDTAEILLGLLILMLFLGLPVGLVLMLIYRKYISKDSQKEQEKHDSYELLLEPLKNMPRENIVGESDGLWRFKAAIKLLLRGSTDYDTRRWKSKEVEELASNVESRFNEKNYRLSEFHLCGIKGDYRNSKIDGNYLVNVNGQELVRIKLEPEKVGEARKIKLKEFKIDSSFESIQLVSRSSSKFNLSLNFDSRSDKKDFTDYLKSNLRSSVLKSYENIWADADKIKELKKAKIGADNNFQNLSPYEFEQFVAKLFRAKGYSARVTSKSGDAGIDVIASKNGEKIAIQVKRHKSSNKVGSPTVQKTLGSLHEINADKAIVITSSRFTQPAKKRARGAPIELWSISKIHREIDRNMI